MSTSNFEQLSPKHNQQWAALHHHDILSTLDTAWLAKQSMAWQTLDHTDDQALTDWLMPIFNRAFAKYDTVLVRGGDEPEYFAKTHDTPAQIVFAHGYFASALHEISHWCIAGLHRRTLNDFGYWYCPDGRDELSQKKFEQVEIKPQAIECLFTLATGRKFFTSADNLNADFDTTASTFDDDVYAQAARYLASPTSLPKDAHAFLALLTTLCQQTHHNH